MAMDGATPRQQHLRFVAAAADGDVAFVTAYLQQPTVRAAVQALDAQFVGGEPASGASSGDEADMDLNMEVEAEEAWYYGHDRCDFVFERVIANRRTELLAWFFAPPTSVWLENTLLYLFARIARLAVEYDAIAMVEMLLQSSLYVERMLAHIRTQVLAQMLDAAICGGNPVMIELLVAHGANVHGASSVSRWPPLVAAAMHDMEGAIVELLVQRGADVTDDRDGEALRMAAASGHLETLRALLRNGADCDTQDADGRTALHVAAKEGLDDVVEVLLTEGYADIDAQDVDGRTPLICGAAEELTASRFDWGDAGSQIRVTDVLLRYGADVHVQDYEHCTALIAAAKNVHIEIMQMLLEHGADPNAQTVDGCTALHFLTGRGRWPAMLDGIELLLAYGGDPEITDVDGDTPHSLLNEDDEGKEWAARLERYFRAPRSRSSSACSSSSTGLLLKIPDEEGLCSPVTTCAMENGGWLRDRCETSSIDSTDAFAISFDQMEVEIMDAPAWPVVAPCALPSACTV